MSEKENVTSESPFYKVLEHWADELIGYESNSAEHLEISSVRHRVTLKNGVQVRITLGRDIFDEDEI